VYNITAVAPPNTKKVAAMTAFPTLTIQNENRRPSRALELKFLRSQENILCEYPAITAFNFSESMGGGVLSRRLSLAVDAK
jgi:hypothetical protein